MELLETLLVVLHVTSNLVWIGSILSVGVLTWHASRTSSKATAEVALLLYKRLAVPAFLAALIFGVCRLMLAPGAYMRLHWFHAKLTFALLVIGLHHVIGAKARKAAGGSMQSGASSAILVAALLSCAFLSVVFVVFKTQLVP